MKKKKKKIPEPSVFSPPNSKSNNKVMVKIKCNR